MRLVFKLGKALSILIVVLLGWSPAIAVAANQSAQADAELAKKTVIEARVVVANRTIVVYRAPFFGASPAQRALRAQRNIAEALARATGDTKVTIRREPQGNVLLINNAFVAVLIPEDADPAAGQTLESITVAGAQVLSQVLAETRESRDHAKLTKAVLRALIATLLLGIAAWVVWRARDVLIRRATRLLETAAARAKLGTVPIWQSSRVGALARWLVKVVSWTLLAVIAYEWLTYVLVQFPFTRPWGEQLGDFIVGIAVRIGNGIIGALPDLTIALVIFLLARSLIGAFSAVFDRVEKGQHDGGWLDKELARPTRRLFNLAVWLFAIVMAYPYLPGADSEAFKGMSVLVGLMLTLGGSSLVGQAANGLILMYSKTLKVGEYVRILDKEGTVTELGAFTTRIRTGLGEEVTFPNTVVMGAVTENYSRAVQGHGYIVDTVVTIGYDTPWRQVEAMLLEAARNTPGVLGLPEPRVFQTALSDFYIEYRLVCQAIPSEPRPRAEVLNMLHANVVDTFNAYGVQIMSPHYLSDPDAEKVVKPTNPFAAPSR